MARASIVIVSWNGRRLLERCLPAVWSQSYSEFEVVLLDNGSTDGSAEWVEARYPSLRLLRRDRNLGFARANNQAIQAARGRYVATLNNDAELKKEAWKNWKIEERFGLEFDQEQAICYGCKELDKPEGIVLSRCTVRQCAREKEFDCCIECNELTACDKDLWTRFPDFKKQVIQLQEKYRQQA